MDGVFVPNLTFGFDVIKQIRQATKKPLDVHLMITEPHRYFKEFRDAGADILTVHYEACTHLHRTIQKIHSLGIRVGVAINPHTPVSVLENILPDVDLVLNMTVNPGFGAQTFIGFSYKKLHELTELIKETGSKALIEIDGGIDLDNIRDLVKTGVNIFVVGNTVFSSPDPAEMISRLKHLT